MTVRNTQQSSDMVERAWADFHRCCGIADLELRSVREKEVLRRLALEASHHAELVEALRDANAYLYAADIGHPVRNRIDALLAKIAGEASPQQENNDGE